ncbi:ribosome biogenesis GTP-binding protein YihA/YsxC [Helicobacter sp.]|uniref:ribosome biogenesis GTP-binding protein YihA/YsxC n=1 Tax=Helicobacter sp. TaxID=218 RepID=UPI0025C16BFF|nr:ribosome biogenesis GTP-binding protein YihA/YsxC [Helicobacter sp.]MCI5968507.1 ribosome biogenesis GTP-binding protein YihA/YsxC [Helicobacter sp.]MDY2584716.1 ribosome biogenesis GTP-binding protein YihA/YsxC [Helicobacter sp.]
MQNFSLTNASFITSAQNLSQCPPPVLSEVAFLGRSNVGKSTLINLLCHQKNLAKSSSTPGKTRLINFFLTQWKANLQDSTKDSINNSTQQEILKLMFVDLPGFGYARVAKSQKELWNRNLVEFLRKRDCIRLFVHLRDSRHPNLEIDTNLLAFVKQFLRGDQRFVQIFTKFDKLNVSEQNKLKSAFPNALFSSSLKRQNTPKIADFIVANTLGYAL